MSGEELFWAEEAPPQAAPAASTRALDLLFALEGRMLPVDHALALGRALREACPALADDPLAGPHLIHPAASGNGWTSPQDGGVEWIYLPRRARLRLRVSAATRTAAEGLAGRRLTLCGHAVRLGRVEARPLRPARTLYCRYLATAAADEPAFLREAAARLAGMGIRPRRMLGGREHAFTGPEGAVAARSLLVTDLAPEASLRLQEEGLGPLRAYGFGLFLPYKEVGGGGAEG
ncbi:type I-MYXAN CRISPR-associated protein Cas6/Cmx6 [Inmirania thermothiophila]|uniref:CRISPR-associated protein Cas6 n=1 Tax=Inmirania thermothiophila TaxID=1750597 RepID=A0A3N1Y032_9GAMM|nr:type I-MYXAN CRISPR-associated protein Cas6/Cmx6 [Inmirania thermothiophila]ROR32179.1 CRISPR-associated protein Cas6 [Inmirania thermothiophila]